METGSNARNNSMFKMFSPSFLSLFLTSYLCMCVLFVSCFFPFTPSISLFFIVLTLAHQHRYFIYRIMVSSLTHIHSETKTIFPHFLYDEEKSPLAISLHFVISSHSFSQKILIQYVFVSVYDPNLIILLDYFLFSFSMKM